MHQVGDDRYQLVPNEAPFVGDDLVDVSQVAGELPALLPEDVLTVKRGDGFLRGNLDAGFTNRGELRPDVLDQFLQAALDVVHHVRDGGIGVELRVGLEVH